MEALIFLCIRCGFKVVASLSLELNPLWTGLFNAVGGCCILSRQAALIGVTRDCSAEPSHVSVLCAKVRDPSGPSGLIDTVPALPLGGSQFP